MAVVRHARPDAGLVGAEVGRALDGQDAGQLAAQRARHRVPEAQARQVREQEAQREELHGPARATEQPAGQPVPRGVPTAATVVRNAARPGKSLRQRR